MKKIMMVLGGVFLAILVIAGAFLGYAAYSGKGLDKSSKDYVDQSLPAIMSGWSKDEFLKRASPELLKVINEKPEALQQLFDGFSKLGALKHYEGSKGEAAVYVDVIKGKTTSANYVAEATFEQGKAEISVRLTQTEGEWKIARININSPVFLK